MPKPSSATNKSPAKTWKSYPVGRYLEVMRGLVHASVKSVNSNAQAGGLRLSVRQEPRHRLVSLRTFLAEGWGVPLDYISMSPTDIATIIKQIEGVLRKQSWASGAPANEVAAIEAAAKAVERQEASFGLDWVDPRLRQVLLPVEYSGTGRPDWQTISLPSDKSSSLEADQEEAPGGRARDADGPADDGASTERRIDLSYLAFTPITPSGLCMLMLDPEDGLINLHNNLVGEAREAKDVVEEGVEAEQQRSALRKIRRAYLGIGGANPQNVGRLIRAFQRPMIAAAPDSRLDQRTAWHLYHAGPQLDLRPSWLSEYRDLLERAGAIGPRDGESEMGSTSRLRAEEESHWGSLVRQVLDEGAQDYELLVEAEEFLPAHLDESGVTEHGWTDAKGVVRRRYSAPRATQDQDLSDMLAGLRDVAFRSDAQRWPDGWSRSAAAWLVDEVTNARAQDGDQLRWFSFDGMAIQSLKTMVENIFAKEARAA